MHQVQSRRGADTSSPPLRRTPSPAPAPAPRSVSKVFVWCLASWDALGVYPESTTAQGSYHNAAISALIRRHNAAARAQRR
jgi:hypothetical protein